MIPTEAEMYHALKERHGEELQKKFGSACVAVCGLGGLGSNVALCLARAGIGKLILIDSDRVDISNLNRQQYKAEQTGMYKTDATEKNLKEIAPYVKTEKHCVKLDGSNMEEILKGADIVCEAFDNPVSKALLTDFVLENMRDSYLVAASGMAGLGESNLIKTRKITGRFYLCGDGCSDVSDLGTLYASRVMICAAHEANAILRIIAEKYDV